MGRMSNVEQFRGKKCNTAYKSDLIWSALISPTIKARNFEFNKKASVYFTYTTPSFARAPYLC